MTKTPEPEQRCVFCRVKERAERLEAKADSTFPRQCAVSWYLIAQDTRILAQTYAPCKCPKEEK